MGKYKMIARLTFVKHKFLRENVFSKPHSAISVKQNLVQIICDSTSELDFTKHVANRVP